MKKKSKKDETKNFHRYGEEDFNSLLEVGITLSSEHDTEKVIDLILEKAIEITDADGASIYLVEKLKQDNLGGARPGFVEKLRFHKSRNKNMRTFEPGFLIDINDSSIAGYVALSGDSVRIRDVYLLEDDSPFSFLKSFDLQSNYRTKSVLAAPVITAKGKILGVLQLVNKLRLRPSLKNQEKKTKEKKSRVPERSIIAFSAHDEKLMQGFASQAAIALENTKLTSEINDLFESFVKASVTAIESRDPSTSGHSDRVARLSVDFAQTIDRISSGPYAKINFSKEQIRELRYAALLHDFGKIGVRENVLLKSKKLYPNELESIVLRLKDLSSKNETRVWKNTAQKLIEMANKGQINHLESVIGQAVIEVDNFNLQIGNIREKIFQANEPQMMSQDFNIKKLLEWVENMSQGLGRSILTKDEAFRLSTSRGTLSDEERKEIESHVSHTYTFLSQIAWTDDLANVAEIAHAHHEKLDGSGYPHNLHASQIPIQARMMTISDIYDALTAMDRPYKKAASSERALEILNSDADNGKIDRALLDIFIEAGIFKSSLSQKNLKKAA